MVVLVGCFDWFGLCFLVGFWLVLGCLFCLLMLVVCFLLFVLCVGGVRDFVWICFDCEFVVWFVWVVWFGGLKFGGWVLDVRLFVCFG